MIWLTIESVHLQRQVPGGGGRGGDEEGAARGLPHLRQGGQRVHPHIRSQGLLSSLNNYRARKNGLQDVIGTTQAGLGRLV